MIAPVVKAVRGATSYHVVVLAYGHGYDRFAARGIVATRIDPVKLDDYSLFDRYDPAFIITSATSFPQRDMSEKYLWEMARVRGVPSIGFLDQWQNYVTRFSGPSPDEAFHYLPDHIACPDKVSVDEMVKEGFDPARLMIFGQPYLQGAAEEYAHTDRDAVRAHPVLASFAPGAKTVLFVSEAIEEHFGDDLGFTQYTALAALIGSLKKKGEPVNLLIKLHPKNDPEKFRALAASYVPCALVSAELTPIQSLAAADVVCGMISILLIEAFLAGKRVFSLQPGRKGIDWLMISRYGYVPCVTGGEFDPFIVAAANTGQKQLDVRFRQDEFLRHLAAAIERREGILNKAGM